MDRDLLVDMLHRFGWLPDRNASEREVDIAIRGYQAMNGLTVDGWAGREVERSIEYRFCAVPDVLPQVEGLRQLPALDITWAVINPLPGLSLEACKESYAGAWARIASVCGLLPKYTTNGRTATVRHHVGFIDGPGRTLAWAELPGGGVVVSNQKYDSGETAWTVSEPGRGEIYHPAVALHESIHSCGVEHGQDIMAPTYDPRVREIGDWSRRQLEQRYGKPRPEAPPPTPPAGVISIELDGEVVKASVPGFRVTRLAG